MLYGFGAGLAAVETQPLLPSQLSAYRLVGDDQLDDRQGVEHSDGGDVPKERETAFMSCLLANKYPDMASNPFNCRIWM